ncbi:MAG: transcriptional regulator, partial [Gordonia sp. (in: high G+C Gram-positive bacteria)]
AAAEAAADAGADRRANGHAERGLRWADPDSAQARDLHRIVGRAAIGSGDIETAEAAFDAAAAIDRRRAAWPDFAHTALLASPNGSAGYWSGYGVLQSSANLLTVEALAHANEIDADARARLHALEAARRSALGLSGATDHHLAAAQCAGPDAGFDVAVADFLLRWEPGRLDERAKIAGQLTELAAGDAGRRATALHLQRICALEAGDLRSARRLSTDFTRIANSTGRDDLLTVQLWWRVMLALLTGDYAKSTEIADEFAGRSGSLSPRARLLAETSTATSASITAWHHGELASALPPFDRLTEEIDDDFALVVALGAAESGEHRRALRMITELSADAAGWTGSRVVARVPLLLEALYAVARDPANAAEAALLAERLAPFVENWSTGLIVQWPGLVCLGPATAYRGLARSLTGLDAAADFQAAVQLADDVGAQPYAQRVRRRLAGL